MRGMNPPKEDRLVLEGNEKSGEGILVQNEARARNMWQKSELLKIAGLMTWKVAPNLNQIEHCWYYLKRQVPKRPFCHSVQLPRNQ